MTVTLLERLEDDFPIGRIWVDEIRGIPVPRAEIGGVICDIETKLVFLGAGIATCIPLDTKLALDWPMQVRIAIEHEDGHREERILETASATPRLVAGALRFLELALDGVAIPGMELA